MNPYKILGILETDSEEEIRQRYKKLALQFHPDKNKDPTAIDKFREISEAYQLVKGGPQGIENDFPEFQELFNFFKDIGSFVKKGPVTRTELTLSLEEIYHGGTFKVPYRKKIFTGKMGQTSAIRQMGPIAFQEIKLEPEFIWEETNIDLELPPGGFHEPITLEMGDHTLSVELREKKHPTFTRIGDDLEITLEITVWEALLGFNRTLIHLDSHELELNCRSIVTPDTVKEIEGEGMPTTETYGKLFVKFAIQFPDQLTTEQRALLQQCIC